MLFTFFLNLFALSGGQDTAFQRVLIPKESLENRKSIPIVKDKKFIGSGMIDESHSYEWGSIIAFANL